MAQRATAARSRRRRRVRRPTAFSTGGSCSRCHRRPVTLSRASSGTWMPSDPFEELGEFLTAAEAIGIATVLAAGQHTSHALREVNAARREQAKALLLAAGLGHANLESALAVLRAIAGAKA